MKRQDKKRIERYHKKLELISSQVHINPYETKEAQKLAVEKAKKDYAFMVERYFPHYASAATPDFHIYFANKVKREPTYKGFAQWGRGLAKSVVNNVLLPFWLWMNEGSYYFVLIGNNSSRAEQLLDDLRAEFEVNPQIRNDFGDQFNPGNWSSDFFITKDGFIGQALGMGQSARGLRVKNARPKHIVADDIETKAVNKNPKRQKETAKWIEREILPTMDGSTRRFIQANNRYAPQMIQTILQDRHPDWHVHQVNAYDPVSYKPAWTEKYSQDYFKSIEKEYGKLAAESEYNNNPHTEGSIFLQKQIQYGKPPRRNQYKIIYGWWDVAYGGTSTSDYNAVIIQGLYKMDFWVLDVFCKQSKMKEAILYMALYQKQLPETVIVHWIYEAQFWNEAVKTAIQEVEALTGVRLNIIKRQVPKTNKYDRILQLQPYYQNGRVFYDERLKHKNDAQVGIAQLLGIEPGYKTHDDYPDAHQCGIAELEKYVSINGDTKNKTTMGGFTPSEHQW